VEPLARPASVLKCEKHGLHYDSAKASGCVVCRRESGELPPLRPGGAAVASGRASGSSGSLGAALAVTVVLVGVATFAMQMVHTQFTEWIRNTGNSSALEGGNTYQQKQMDGVLQELKDQSGETDVPAEDGEEEGD
jgi:hypothetical protein